jgi:hypothetical protein
MPSYVVAAGAVLTGVAIWLGTTSEPVVRVGDPGISVDRGEVRRMPWWAVSSITWESGNLALVITGHDEGGTAWTFKVSVSSQPEAVGWIVSEAQRRVPKVVDIDEAVLEKFPPALPHAGMKIDLEPLQVVGKRDAVTREIISYEPDATVCARCERIYKKREAPKKCKCGALLSARDAGVDEETQDDERATSAEAERSETAEESA